jgi:uncharacterized protein YydD (DUF2326 family)
MSIDGNALDTVLDSKKYTAQKMDYANQRKDEIKAKIDHLKERIPELQLEIVKTYVLTDLVGLNVKVDDVYRDVSNIYNEIALINQNIKDSNEELQSLDVLLLIYNNESK